MLGRAMGWLSIAEGDGVVKCWGVRSGGYVLGRAMGWLSVGEGDGVFVNSDKLITLPRGPCFKYGTN